MYKCLQAQHDRCENSSLCHLCDGQSLYKNQAEEKKQKQERALQRKKEEKHTLFREYKEEKKEGMQLEKDVVSQWNGAFQSSSEPAELFKQPKKKMKVQKPRIQLEEIIAAETAAYVEPPSFPSIHLSNLPSPSKPKENPISDAKRQINSGALWYAKGDVKTQDYLMECKERSTINAKGEKTISIPKDWLVKQEKEAFQENRPYWILPFRYKNDSMIYMVKPFEQEIEMYQEIRRLREELSRLQSK